MAELLAGSGANIDTKTGYTALHFAVIHDHEAIISILVDDHGANINIRDNSGRKAKHYLKKDASPWLQRKLGKSVKLTVSPLTSSLESGLNRLGIDEDDQEQQEQHSQRKGSIAKFYQNLRGKTKRRSSPAIHLIPENMLEYQQKYGRAKSAPDINNLLLHPSIFLPLCHHDDD